MNKINTYRDAGVDIERGDRFVEYIKNLSSSAVSSSLGGFSGGVEIDTSSYTHPVVFSTTDGVGTKLLVAAALGDFSTIGIDLVAMCVNDLLVCNVMPLSFLDYIACGKLDEQLLEAVMHGIVEGCEQAGCTLAGGETAELPDLYAEGTIDLAGFCLGVAEKSRVLPKKEEIGPGDIVFGLPSSGIHSNGLTLARKVLPFDEHPEQFRTLLTPTRIYRRELEYLLSLSGMKGAAHITGGGLYGNINRVLPDSVTLTLTWDWPVPQIFTSIQEQGNISDDEMRAVFNMGVGIAIIVDRAQADSIIEECTSQGLSIFKIGECLRG
jgi:phosphoribosylformylglycinamidine cyclo-ligase